MGIIKKTIESGIESGSITKADISRALGRSYQRSRDYSSLLKKADEMDKVLKNLGFKIAIVGGGGKK